MKPRDPSTNSAVWLGVLFAASAVYVLAPAGVM
jgi:hypothetical protein